MRFFSDSDFIESMTQEQWNTTLGHNVISLQMMSCFTNGSFPVFSFLIHPLVSYFYSSPPSLTDVSRSSLLTARLLSINGGRRKEDERSLCDNSFIRRAVQFQILIITLNYSHAAGLHCVALNELSHTCRSAHVDSRINLLQRT